MDNLPIDFRNPLRNVVLIAAMLVWLIATLVRVIAGDVDSEVIWQLIAALATGTGAQFFTTPVHDPR